MRLSTKGRYGVRLMLDLALHEDDGPVTMKDIAARQEISEKYLSNLIPLLKNAGFVRSVRGPQGGYTLARSPGDITLKDILFVLEGSMCLVECSENPKLCHRSEQCPMRDVWSEVTGKMQGALQLITLQAMMDRQMLKETEPSYDI